MKDLKSFMNIVVKYICYVVFFWINLCLYEIICFNLDIFWWGDSEGK